MRNVRRTLRLPRQRRCERGPRGTVVDAGRPVETAARGDNPREVTLACSSNFGRHMNFFSLPLALATRASKTRSSTCWASRSRSRVPSSSRPRSIPSPTARAGHGGRSAVRPRARLADWAGSRWGCWSSPRCPASREESWVPKLRETDALLVWGGHVMYLCYWMRQSGLADLLPSLSNTVYVGVSAGSIVMTPHNPDVEFNLQWIPAGSDLAREGDRGAGAGRFRGDRARGSRGLQTPRPTWKNGPPESPSRRTRSTTRPPSR